MPLASDSLRTSRSRSRVRSSGTVEATVIIHTQRVGAVIPMHTHIPEAGNAGLEMSRLNT